MDSLVEQASGPLPIPIRELETMRLRMHRNLPTAGLGAHLRRKLGQAQEFRDYRSYVPGDDVRRIDWRASLRRGLRYDYVVRTFEAEERLSVSCAIDTRPSMFLPARHSKILVAAWIGRALAAMLQRNRDSLHLYSLFGNEPAPLRLRGLEIERRAAEFMAVIARAGPGSDRDEDWQAVRPLNSTQILRDLQTAGVLVLISDLYFREDGEFHALLRRAQRGYRHVVLVILDSWPAERSLLSSGAIRLSGVEGAALPDHLVEPQDEELEGVGQRIHTHWNALLDNAQAGGLVSDIWQWPTTIAQDSEAARRHFHRTFLAFNPLKSLFGHAP